MTTDSQRRIPRIQRFLFWGHTAVFAFLWIIALSYTYELTARIVRDSAAQFLLFFLVWMLVYLVHLMSFVQLKAGAQAGGNDRQAYREGLRDGMREAMALQSDSRADQAQLMIDDDGELLEQMQGEKAKRREIR